MPIEIRFTDDGEGLIYTAKGHVAGDEIIETDNLILYDDRLKDIKYKIVDRTLVTEYDVSDDHIKKLATHNTLSANINPELIVAFISGNESQRKAFDKYKKHLDHLDEERSSDIRNFSNFDEAESWAKQTLENSKSANVGFN